jgi:hypothetical protein
VIVEAPDKVRAGEVFKAMARVEYFDGSKWLPLDARTVGFRVDYVLSREDVSRMKWAGVVNGVATVDLRIDSTGEHYVCARVYDFDPLAGWYGFQKLSSCKKVIVEPRQAPVTTPTQQAKPIQPQLTQPSQTAQTSTPRATQSPTLASIIEQTQNPPPAIVFKKSKRPELLIPI